MSNLPFKKFRKELNERRNGEPELGDEYKKLSPVMKGAINDVYSMINNTPDPIVDKIQGIIETPAKKHVGNGPRGKHPYKKHVCNGLIMQNM